MMSGHSLGGACRPARRIRLILLLLAVAPFTAHAQVPDVPNVPTNIPGAARLLFLTQRDQFVARREAFMEEATAHNAQCKQVPLHTPEAASCEEQRDLLKNELAKLQSAAAGLNADIDGARRVRAPTPVDPNGNFVIKSVEFHGEFYVTTSDGQRLSGHDAAQVPIDNGALMETGPDSVATVTLPDDTLFTLGPNSRMMFDTFVWDPGTSYRPTIAAEVVIGTLRWVTGHMDPSHAKKLIDPSGRVRMIDPTKPNWYKGLTRGEIELIAPVGTIGVRGTNFELEVKPDGSSLLKLHAGLVDITPRSGGKTVTLAPGEMVSISAAGHILGPKPIP